MAAMTEPERLEIHARIMRDLASFGPWAITKVDLKAAIDAIDVWIDSNAASFNNALPAAAKSGLITAQKTLLLSYVLLKRVGK